MLRITTYLLLTVALPGAGEVIDRVAIVIGNSVVTTSEIDLQLRLAAFMNGVEPDFSVPSRRRAADRLIEQVLLRREMSGPGAPPVSGTEATEQQLLAGIRSRYGTGAAYSAALARYGITQEELEHYVSWQSRVLQFIDQRFRPSIALNDADVRDYYENTFVYQWTETHPGKQPPSFDSVREEMERQTLSERANNAVDRWLGQARTQTSILFKVEDLQ